MTGYTTSNTEESLCESCIWFNGPYTGCSIKTNSSSSCRVYSCDSYTCRRYKYTNESRRVNNVRI